MTSACNQNKINKKFKKIFFLLSPISLSRLFSFPNLDMMSTSTMDADLSYSFVVLYIFFAEPVMTSSPHSLPPTLSASDFPALVSTTDPRGSRRDERSPTENNSPVLDDKAQVKAERKAAKRAAAAEKAAEKQVAAQEKAAAKAAEKAKVAQEKIAEKERLAALKAEQEKLQREKLEKEKAARNKALQEEKEKLAKLEKVKAAKEAARTEKVKTVHVKKTKQGDGQKSSKRPDPAASAANDPAPTTPSEPSSQVPLLSKKPKKNKPISKPIRVSREETSVEDSMTISSTSVPEISHVSIAKPSHHTSESSSNNSRAQSVDQFMSNDPTSVEELLEDINLQDPVMDLPNHVFFDIHKINPCR
jgi:CCR4-NOT transcription complex subunit 4